MTWRHPTTQQEPFIHRTPKSSSWKTENKNPLSRKEFLPLHSSRSCHRKNICSSPERTWRRREGPKRTGRVGAPPTCSASAAERPSEPQRLALEEGTSPREVVTNGADHTGPERRSTVADVRQGRRPHSVSRGLRISGHRTPGRGTHGRTAPEDEDGSHVTILSPMPGEKRRSRPTAERFFSEACTPRRMGERTARPRLPYSFATFPREVEPSEGSAVMAGRPPACMATRRTNPQAESSGSTTGGRRESRASPSSTSANVRTMAVSGADLCGALVLV